MCRFLIRRCGWALALLLACFSLPAITQEDAALPKDVAEASAAPLAEPMADPQEATLLRHLAASQPFESLAREELVKYGYTPAQVAQALGDAARLGKLPIISAFRNVSLLDGSVSSPPKDFQFSPDGRWLMYQSWGYGKRLLNLASGEQVERIGRQPPLPPTTEETIAAAVAVRTALLSESAQQYEKAKAVRALIAQRTTAADGGPSADDVVVSADSRRLAYQLSNGFLGFESLERGGGRSEMKISNDVDGLSINIDGSRILRWERLTKPEGATGWQPALDLRLLDGKGKELKQLRVPALRTRNFYPSHDRSLPFSPDGRRFYAACDERFCEYAAADGQRLRSLPLAWDSEEDALSLSADGSTLLVDRGERMSLLRLDAGAVVVQMKAVRGHCGCVLRSMAALSADGRRVAVLELRGDEARATLLDGTHGAVVSSGPWFAAKLDWLGFSSDGQSLIAASYNGAWVQWQIEGWQAQMTYGYGGSSRSQLTMAADGTRFIVLERNRTDTAGIFTADAASLRRQGELREILAASLATGDCARAITASEALQDLDGPAYFCKTLAERAKATARPVRRSRK